MDRMGYELFLRGAFGYALSTQINRNGDPAQLADTDTFNSNYLSKVKFGLGYAMEIYITDIVNNCDVTDPEDTRINAYSDNLINCQTINDVSNLMDDFLMNVFQRYYTQVQGVITLNCP